MTTVRKDAPWCPSNLQSSDADNALTAARRTFRQLFLPGMIAILADAVGFITLADFRERQPPSFYKNNNRRSTP